MSHYYFLWKSSCFLTFKIFLTIWYPLDILTHNLNHLSPSQGYYLLSISEWNPRRAIILSLSQNEIWISIFIVFETHQQEISFVHIFIMQIIFFLIFIQYHVLVLNARNCNGLKSTLCMLISLTDKITQLHEEIPIHITPIGYIRSVFQFKNGTPRQSGVVRTAMGKLAVDRSIFNNPEHSLTDLNQFSHVW